MRVFRSSLAERAPDCSPAAHSRADPEPPAGSSPICGWWLNASSQSARSRFHQIVSAVLRRASVFAKGRREETLVVQRDEPQQSVSRDSACAEGSALNSASVISENFLRQSSEAV